MPESRLPGVPEPRVRGLWLRGGLLVLILAAAIIAAAVVGLPDVAALQSDIAAAGPAAPVVFVLAYAALTLAPVPKNVLSAVAGLLFGLVTGIALVFVAAMLGALTAFWLGRVLGRGAVERFTGARVARVDELLARRGVMAVIGVRLVPVVPFTAINYTSGLTGVRLGDYTLGTAVGIVPGTVAYVTLGTYGSAPVSWPVALSAAALGLLTAAGVVAARRSRARAASEVTPATRSEGDDSGDGVDPAVAPSPSRQR